MKDAYAQALIRTARTDGAKVAVERMVALLKRHGRVALLPGLVSALKRELVREAKYPEREVIVARAADASTYATDTDQVRVDESLIGGYQVREKDTLHDRSYKKQLLSIYQKALS